MAQRRFYGLRKILTDVGVYRGAQQAFSPAQRPLEPSVVMTDERLRMHPSLMWIGAAVLYATAGSVPLLTTAAYHLFGLSVPEVLRGPVPMGLAGSALGLACIWLIMAHRRVHAMPWLHVIIGIGSLMIAAGAFASDEYGPDVLSYFLIPAMAAAFFLSIPGAITHISAIGAAMLTIGFINSNVPNSMSITLNTLFFTMLSGFLLAIARKRIQDGILHNVALAGRDPLTGVANLRKFNERLEIEIDRAGRKNQPLTLLMIDLDDFKLVNDRYSYTLGDAVLVASARAMSRVVRGHELLARRGGDEFAVIAVGADQQDADALADRIRHAVCRERTKLCPEVNPDASVGVAIWRPGENAADLVRRSDSALHVSKLIAHSQDPYGDM